MTEAFLQHIGAQDILNKPEAAAFLRIKKRTLDDWMRRGLIPYSKLPTGTVRFRRSQLLEFLAKFQSGQ